MKTKKVKRSKVITTVVVLAAFAVAGGLYWRNNNLQIVKDEPKPVNATTSTPTESPQPAFNKAKYSLTDPNSFWVVVNKRRPLPAGFEPADLVPPGVPTRLSAGAPEMQVRTLPAYAMKKMFDAAQTQASLKLMLVSGYRSEGVQRSLYASYVAQKGQAAADLDSARAGFSEHQTGLAFDVGATSGKCQVDPCFGGLPEGQWIAANSYKYGFVVRYLPGKQPITGYIAEPWHLRYVGEELAAEVYRSGLTLEEFFGLPAAPNYL